MCEEEKRLLQSLSSSSFKLCIASYHDDGREFDQQYSRDMDTRDVRYSLSGDSVLPSISPSIPIPEAPERSFHVLMLVRSAFHIPVVVRFPTE